MLIVETIARIRREHLVKGKSIKQIECPQPRRPAEKCSATIKNGSGKIVAGAPRQKLCTSAHPNLKRPPNRFLAGWNRLDDEISLVDPDIAGIGRLF